MGILKGQNFRILTIDSNSKMKCVGMATSCTVNLNTNTDDASTKDDTGMASKPEVTSKSWQVSVESLSVTDTAAMLTAIKSLTPFTLIWDETSPTDNQTPETRDFARMGQAYLSDGTFQFENRANSTKSLQFTGSGALQEVDTSGTTWEEVPAGSYTKGQYVRLFLGSDNTTTPAKVIAAASSLSLHVSVSLENATTKDTDGDWDVQEPTGISYDISTSALVKGNDTITSSVQGQEFADLLEIYEGSTPVKFQIANVSGANNRTKGAVIVSGSVIISSLSVNAANRQNVTYDASLNSWGDFVVGS